MSIGIALTFAPFQLAQAQDAASASAAPVSSVVSATSVTPAEPTAPTIPTAPMAPTASVPAVPVAGEDAGLVARGAYLAQAGDCIACHTAKGGQPFAGGLALATPIGTIYSTNITPSAGSGIGHYTEAQFAAALRQGKRADGAQLYPAMPYTSYAKISDDDVHALYSYFMHGVKAVDVPAPRTALPFPFNLRISMWGWNLLFLNDHRFVADPQRSAEWNRGAYLVEGLAHCSTCHTPRNALMAEEEGQALSGASVSGWYAPNVTSDAQSGIGGWSQADIVTYLRSGTAPGKAQAAGPMAEAIDHSFRHLTDADLQAMAVYLRTVPAVHHASDTQAPYTWGKPIANPDLVRSEPLPADPDHMTGPQLYDANCASCHQANGQGSKDGGLPSLYHNTALGHATADNLVLAILQGVAHPGNEDPDAVPAGVDMPAFADKLSDAQVATLSNYLMTQFGHPAKAIDAADVRILREGGAPSPLLKLARWGMIAGAIVLLIIVIGMIVGMRRRRA